MLQNIDTHSVYGDVRRHNNFDKISLAMGLHPADAVKRETEANVPGSKGEIHAKGLNKGAENHRRGKLYAVWLDCVIASVTHMIF